MNITGKHSSDYTPSKLCNSFIEFIESIDFEHWLAYSLEKCPWFDANIVSWIFYKINYNKSDLNYWDKIILEKVFSDEDFISSAKRQLKLRLRRYNQTSRSWMSDSNFELWLKFLTNLNDENWFEKLKSEIILIVDNVLKNESDSDYLLSI